MEILLIFISVLLIALVLLQSGKAEASSAITGGNDSLFQNRKERGGELFLSRLTLVCGISFFAVCIIMNIM